MGEDNEFGDGNLEFGYFRCVGKIFGIGLSRTGTSSLNEALEILGYRSIHFPKIMANSSLHAKLNYRLSKWGKELGASKPLFPDFTHNTKNELVFKQPSEADFDALTDLPTARFYRELDAAFPNSKFILTVRDEESWLRSCSKFFAKENHQFFKWQQLHLDMYGSNRFDSALFQEAYLNHLKDVKSYFANRPNDLLVMNIPNGDGWEKLCPFLEKSQPEQPFPKANAAKN
jgi:hypothetical protein